MEGLLGGISNGLGSLLGTAASLSSTATGVSIGQSTITITPNARGSLTSYIATPTGATSGGANATSGICYTNATYV